MELNFFSTFIYGYILVASILIYIFNRDRRNNTVFFGKHTTTALSFISILSIGIVLALYSRFIEPYWINVTHTTSTIAPTVTGEHRLKKPVPLVLISDLHVGEHKKAAWIQKVVNEIKKIKPDLVLLAGDYTSNHGTIADETTYLEPLAELSQLFPIYYVMGNHEYGLYGRGFQKNPDKSDFIKKRMAELNIPLLLNNFDCPEIKQQTICLFGIDDVYKENFNFPN
jgi:predicted MPP superfamily phosphohydrolase